MDVIMPQLGETVVEGTVTRWYKKVGDSIKADEKLFDVETDKVSTEIPAPASGVLAEILVDEGATAKVGVRLAVIRESGAVTSPRAAAQATTTVSARSPAPAVRVPAAIPAGDQLSPVVRKLIAEHELNPGDIRGTGRENRITRDDVLAFIERRGVKTPAAPQPAPRVSAGGETRIPFNTIRKRTAEHMVRSWTTVPHVLQAVEADFSRIEQARHTAGAAWKAREGFTLTYLPFIAQAVAIALAKFPRLNASIDGSELVLHRRIDIGIAVDLDLEGLVVPVVRDVPGKSLPQIAREINDLAQRARSNRLKPDEISGGM